LRHGSGPEQLAATALNETLRRLAMKWETPTACDFRFGFEITMYIAAR
jgi:coenzyme PQQ precursor peptide PqqA